MKLCSLEEWPTIIDRYFLFRYSNFKERNHPLKAITVVVERQILPTKIVIKIVIKKRLYEKINVGQTGHR